MENKIIQSLNEYVKYLERIQDNQLSRQDDLKDYKKMRLKLITKQSGKNYYLYKLIDKKSKEDHKSSPLKYLGTESREEVGLIKEAHYYEKSLAAIQSNLELCNNLLDKFRFTDYDSINEVLPKTYKNPPLHMTRAYIRPEAQKWKEDKEKFKERCGAWYPDGLKVATADRNMVRSKSEALIYNQYLSLGVTYIYELPIILGNGIVRHPDFTILSEVDWASFILHDHEGMYGFDTERVRYNEDMYLYWKNGFIPGINIFYTFDDPNGGFDMGVVRDIVNSKVRPS